MWSNHIPVPLECVQNEPSIRFLLLLSWPGAQGAASDLRWVYSALNLQYTSPRASQKNRVLQRCRITSQKIIQVSWHRQSRKSWTLSWKTGPGTWGPQGSRCEWEQVPCGDLPPQCGQDGALCKPLWACWSEDLFKCEQELLLRVAEKRSKFLGWKTFSVFPQPCYCPSKPMIEKLKGICIPREYVHCWFHITLMTF